jgi:hypothetical protein
MKGWALGLALAAGSLAGQAQPGAVIRVEYSNPGLTPAKWAIEVHPDGKAHFHSDPGEQTAAELHTIEPGTLDRDIQLSQEFAAHAFATAHHHSLFAENCESHLKVAFQGWKTLHYSGADGEGSCGFNYSKNKEIQDLGESFVAVASTIVEGARLELLLQHDPLGLDKEMEFLKEAKEDGRLKEMCAIQPILNKLADDPEVMERVRRRARMLLVPCARSRNELVP